LDQISIRITEEIPAKDVSVGVRWRRWCVNRADAFASLAGYPTIGTTGRSKGAMLTHGNLASNAETLAAVWHFSPADVLLHALPIYHTHGLFVAVNTVLFSGGN
jgi:acyl-CoA synthetase (AMP-forming)/AMP-acid ligase II